MITFQKDQYAAGFKTFSEMGAPVPAGDYVCVISEIVDEENRNDASVRFLKTVLTIDEGQYEKRKIFTRYYYQNEIGLGRFLALAKAAGYKVDPKVAGVDEKALVGCKIVAHIANKLNKKSGEINPEFSYAKPFDPNAVSKSPDPDVPFAN